MRVFIHSRTNHWFKEESIDRIIEAQDLRKNYGNLVAVDGISFSVKKGEVFGCLGNLVTYSGYFDIPAHTAQKKSEKLPEFVQLQEKRNVEVEKLSGGDDAEADTRPDTGQ